MPCQKIRRSGRITIAVPILLIGSACEGRVLSEETKTVIISLRGAGILSRHKLVSEQELVLRSLESDREAEIRVVGEIGTQGDFHAYGVALVHETLDFWKISFPPPEAPHETVSSLFLNAQVAPHLSYWNLEISNSTSASFMADWSVKPRHFRSRPRRQYGTHHWIRTLSLRHHLRAIALMRLDLSHPEN
jgi:hypothetical protein